WAVGIAASGNEIGLSLEEWTALPDAEKEIRRAAATQALRAAGARLVIDTIAELPAVIAENNAQLADGGMPCPAGTTTIPSSFAAGRGCSIDCATASAGVPIR